MSLLSLLSCASEIKAVEEERPGPGEPEKARGYEKPPETYSLGITPERFFLYADMNAECMFEAQAAVLVRGLTLEEKIGQLFIISLWDPELNDFSKSLGKHEKEMLTAIRPGGVIFFGGNIDTEEQVSKLCSDLQAETRIPLFIATDQEGGRIGRLYHSGKIPATRLPAPFHIGETGNPDFAYLSGWVTARELSFLGINLNFAPVADVLMNTTHPVIGTRSFGTDPEKVAIMSTAFARGTEAGGVIPVMKHFPGHGGAAADPHYGGTVDSRGLKEIEGADLLPFTAAVNDGIPCIMTSHVVMSGVAEDNLPASCSLFINTNLLRERLGFKGLIITDSLSMGAIISRWEPEDAVVRAVKAGADCLLEPSAPKTSYKALQGALQNGTVSEEVLNNSVQRIFLLKLKSGIIPWQSDWGPDPKLYLRETGRQYRDRNRINAILDKYIPGWKAIDATGIGNDLHKRISILVMSSSEKEE